MRRIVVSLITVLLMSCLLLGQSSSDLFLMDMTITNGQITLSDPVNLTQRDGYDSQPAFLMDDSGIIYASIREDGQADIYKYDIDNKTISRITFTDIGHEYSPTPFSDTHFSTVRIEEDTVTQRLWQFDTAGKEKSLLLKDIYRVGYHGWADDHTVGLFVLGEKPEDPFTFQIADLRSGTAQVICENPGRSFHKVPGENALSYIHKETEEQWWIKKIDLQTKEITKIIKTLPASEDLHWIPSIKTILMGKENVLYAFDTRQDSNWREIKNFDIQVIAKINRIVVNHRENKIVIVSSK